MTTYTVVSPHTSSGLTLLSGDQMTVMSGGHSVSNTVDSGAALILRTGGTDSGTTVNSGGVESFAVGATVSNLTLESGAILAESGFALTGGGNAMTVAAITAPVVVGSVGVAGTKLDVVEAISTGIGSGAMLFVSSGGESLAAVVNGGGFEFVYAGAVANATTIDGGAEQIIEGGSASATLVNGSGAYQYLYAGTTATAGLIHDGGTEMVSHGAVTIGDTIDTDSTEMVCSGGAASRTVVSAGGQLMILADGSAADARLAGGTLIVDNGGVALGGVTYGAAGGTLAVVSAVGNAGSNAVAATLSGLTVGDTIDLSGIAYVSQGAGASVTDDVLTVTNGGKSYTFQVAAGQSYAGDTFAISASADLFGGTDVTVTADATTFTCFVAGTRIATPLGMRAVETLRPGDAVLTMGGAARVRWLGVQTVAPAGHDPLRALPVRIRAGALGAAIPSRDLLLSPLHAVLIDGVLAQAGALVNGVSIVRETGMTRPFRYYHVELADHAIIFAEDTPAESYLDGVEQTQFDNEAERPAGSTAVELPYPRVKAPRQLPTAIRARIAACARDMAEAA